MKQDLAQRLAYIQEHTIYEIVHGSRAYGTSTPSSDYDKKGICILPDINLYFGMEKFEQQDGGWDSDKVVYDLRKFMSLAGNCNPNIIEILYCDESDIIKITEAGRKLRAHRELFLSKKAKHTFSGYSYEQLKKIRAKKETFDRKDAMHLVRLLRMGHEILTEGKVIVRRPDAQELLTIRNGAWDYEKLITYAEEMEAKINAAYETSPLPHAPQWEKIQSLQVELLLAALREANAL